MVEGLNLRIFVLQSVEMGFSSKEMRNVMIIIWLTGMDVLKNAKSKLDGIVRH